MLLKEEIIDNTFLSNCVNNVKIAVESDKLIFYCENNLSMSKTLNKLGLILNHYEKDLNEVLDQTGAYLTIVSDFNKRQIIVKECC